eukprot:5318871-Pleurochrysis_carterae.AAC.1
MVTSQSWDSSTCCALCVCDHRSISKTPFLPQSVVARAFLCSSPLFQIPFLQSPALSLASHPLPTLALPRPPCFLRLPLRPPSTSLMILPAEKEGGMRRKDKSASLSFSPSSPDSLFSL